jgi:uncharacterized membrane protein YdjX (TVP38/TMEM64 family)
VDRLTIAILILLMAGAVVLSLLPPMSVQMLGRSVEGTAALIRTWGGWGVAGSIGLMVAHSFLPFPAEIVAIANGMIFGPVWGTIITWTGAMLGAAAAFAIARWLGRPFIVRFMSSARVQQLDAWSVEHGASALLVARLVPVVAFNLINYAAALTRVSWWTFFWTTAVGLLPFTILLSVFGGQIFTLSRSVWIVLILIAALAWLVLRRYRHRDHTARSESDD